MKLVLQVAIKKPILNTKRPSKAQWGRKMEFILEVQALKSRWISVYWLITTQSPKCSQGILTQWFKEFLTFRMWTTNPRNQTKPLADSKLWNQTRPSDVLRKSPTNEWKKIEKNSLFSNIFSRLVSFGAKKFKKISFFNEFYLTIRFLMEFGGD